MYEEYLQKIGLTEDQARVYSLLVKHGPSQASFITRQVQLSRPLVYKVLHDLESLHLVDKVDEKGKITIFQPTHPSSLETLVQTKKNALEDSELALSTVLEKMVSEYNLAVGKPGVRFLIGAEGLKRIYQDILETNKDFHLIRPRFESTFNEHMVPIVKDFITARVRKNIHVTALTPTDIEKGNEEKDASLLLTRVWVPLSLYNSPVEVNIYGNKVAFLSYAKELVGIIIDSPQIAESMRQLFILAGHGASSITPDQKSETP